MDFNEPFEMWWWWWNGTSLLKDAGKEQANVRFVRRRRFFSAGMPLLNATAGFGVELSK